jgi:single-strand DNA-binding protein
MARGVNKVILVGNLGNDPDVKYTQGGMAITTLSVATTSVRKDRDGNTQEKTEWHRVKLFGKLGEIAGEYLRKGRQVYLEGRLEYGSYEKDGVKHYTTDIVADEMQMLGGNDGQRGGGGYAQQQGGGDYAAAPSRAPRAASAPAQNNFRSAAPAAAPSPDHGDFSGQDFSSEDIPF